MLLLLLLLLLPMLLAAAAVVVVDSLAPLLEIVRCLRVDVLIMLLLPY
jgi:hypothetical protein